MKHTNDTPLDTLIVVRDQASALIEEIGERELYWAAGLLEGEGSFISSIKHDRQYGHAYRYLKIKVLMTDLDILERLKDVLGCGTIYGPQKVRSTLHTPAYVWQLGRQDLVVPLLSALYPLMGARRQGQIEAILSEPTGRIS